MAVSQATTGDVVSRSLRTLTDAEKTWAGVRLRDAFNVILTTIPGTGDTLDDGVVTDPFNQLVIQTQANMVLRVLANPDGILEVSSDDYTRRLDASVSTGALYMTAAEIDLLGSALSAAGGAGNGTDGAFSVRPVNMFPNPIPDPFTTTSAWY